MYDLTANGKRLRTSGFFTKAECEQAVEALRMRIRSSRYRLPGDPDLLKVDLSSLRIHWADEPKNLPEAGGVYFITAEASMLQVLYVGQAKNLRTRLQGLHLAWRKAKAECSCPWIVYQLVEDEQLRKNYEHLMIGKLAPLYNDGKLETVKRKL